MHCIKLIGLFCTIFFAIFLTANVVAQQTTPDETDTNTPAESRFLSNIRQLTYDGKRAGEGYFSEDGNALIFQSEREPDNPFYQIYLLNLLTGDTQRVSPVSGKQLVPSSDRGPMRCLRLDTPRRFCESKTGRRIAIPGIWTRASLQLGLR